MPRRTSIPRKAKYEAVPANRTTARFSAKLMTNGKQRLADAAGSGGNHDPGTSAMRAEQRSEAVTGQCQPRETAGDIEKFLAMRFDNGARQSQTDRAFVVTPVAKPGRLEGAIDGAEHVRPGLINALTQRRRTCLGVGEQGSTCVSQAGPCRGTAAVDTDDETNVWSADRNHLDGLRPIGYQSSKWYANGL